MHSTVTSTGTSTEGLVEVQDSRAGALSCLGDLCSLLQSGVKPFAADITDLYVHGMTSWNCVILSTVCLFVLLGVSVRPSDCPSVWMSVDSSRCRSPISHVLCGTYVLGCECVDCLELNSRLLLAALS